MSASSERLLPFAASIAAALLAVFVIRLPAELNLRNYLERSDARIVLLWFTCLPLLWGAFLLRLRRPRGAALTAIGAVFFVLVAAFFWSETNQLVTFIPTPALGALGALVAAAGAVRKFAPSFFRTNLALFIFGFALGGSTAAGAGWESWIERDLPPAFHDEYAYLFQARTFLDGRLFYPPDGLAPAFEQVHIISEPVVACRYFTGTALWLAPFVALRCPIAAIWVAHGLVAGFFALAAARVSRPAGWLTAILIGTAPGLVLFANSLLSPTPTMAALGAFTWAWLGVHNRACRKLAATAGLAIGFAFLIRPLTAAGIGFPFALYSLWSWWMPRFPRERAAVSLMALIFVLVVASLPLWNFATLGTPWETPYSRYTRTKTPSHVFGFYNVERGHPLRSSANFHPYDGWATNLTPDLAAPTVASRIDAALREGLGGRLWIALLLFLSAATLRRAGDRVLLLWLAVVGLAAAYTPYWFVGVFGYGYFAEALPFLLVLAAVAATTVGRCKPCYWTWAFVALAALRVFHNVAVVIPLLSDGDVMFARLEKQRIVDVENAALKNEGCNLLVLVNADPKTAVHSTLVYNRPRLDGPVVRAWAKPQLINALLDRFPERAVYQLDYKGFAEPFEWRRLRGPLRR